MMDLIGWLFLLILVLGAGAFIGIVLSERERADERARLAEDEDRLAEAWEGLERTQRLNEAFWRARIALRNEALRHQQGMTGPSDPASG